MNITEHAEKYAKAVLLNLPNDYDAKKRIITTAIVRAIEIAFEEERAYLHKTENKRHETAFKGIIASLTQNRIFPADVAYVVSIAKTELGQHTEHSQLIADAEKRLRMKS